MTGEPYINLLMQIPLVGLFVWFILKRDERADIQQRERDEQWRSFLQEQREQNNAALQRLAGEISLIAQKVGDMSETLSAHDAIVRAATSVKTKPLKK